MASPYTQVSIPDTVAWRSPPPRTDGSTEGAALPAQDLFRKISPSVYWDARLIQFTAAISPGSSGGGLFDARGNLVAITSYSLKGAQGINFAIPAEDFWR
jgi:S1-C subfamily serine protease